MGKKIIRTIADARGNLVKFLAEGTDTWLTKELAIQKATAGEIDAIVVRPKKGLSYLRAKGDKSAVNNFDKIAIRPRKRIYSEWHFATGAAPPYARPNPNTGWNTKPRSIGDTAASVITFALANTNTAQILALPLNEGFVYTLGR